VSLRDGPLGEIKPPLAWVTALALIVVAALALALFFGNRPSAARGVADGALAKAAGVVSAPIRWTGDGVDAVRAYFLAGSQNRRLRADLAEARAWQDRALALTEENARLRALLGVRTEPPLPMVGAATVLEARGPFSNSRLADAGADRGVTEGNPVLSDHGLVGRVVGVAPHASRIMLLTDVESRTPVLVARTNGRAILTGDGGPNPSLAYLRGHDALREGDRILTSGDGGVLPRGLPVGVVVKGFDGAWRVALDSDASAIDFVRIMLFKDFSQLSTPGELAPKNLPGAATEAPPPPKPSAQTTSPLTP